MKLPHNWLKHLPNSLTLFRIFLVPIILLLYPLRLPSTDIICGFLFIIASITDFVDGYIARRFSLETKLGRVLDPIADKILSAAGLIILASTGRMPIIIAGLLLCRDVAISGLRTIAVTEGISVEVSALGKYKTFFQFTCIALLILYQPIFGLPIKTAGMICMWIALVLSLYSAYLYLREYIDSSEGEEEGQVRSEYD